MGDGSNKSNTSLKNPKKQASQITAVRLPSEVVCRIDALVGRGNRSRFIAAAVEKELKRRARLAHLEEAGGFIPDDLDALVFVNRLRAWDERAD